ncbi:multidrug effflux MFS transporter [Tessaracoccus defluvii]|uniref:Multidrug effflux MFS transporter n=1 Tax=Tessaracoccus defluvii TaxID=1285901 RepID=A0A7H0H869_9ACTN|nr:multidrug effflux MFS transporter [Tessaracoccus defluvii]QNP56735.1 multidrug effflux MFS transporter [Tessaracoccus defluvii]
METDLGRQFSRRRRIAIIVTLGLLTGLGPFTIDLYLPAFPVLKQEWSLTDSAVQVTLSATTLGFAMGQLFVGTLSDRFGRRLPLILCSSLHVISSVMVALAGSVEFLIVMRALQGVGAAGGAVVAMAMTRDLFSGKPLVVMLSRLALISGLAPIIAPIVGSWMVSFMPWRGVFWALAGYGLIIVLLVSLMTVETRPPAARTTGGVRSLARGFGVVAKDRVAAGAMMVAAFSFGGLFAYVSSSSVLLQEVYGLTVRGFGTVFAICSFGVFIGVQLGSRAAQRYGAQWVLVISTTLMIAASLGVLAVHAADVGHIPLVPALFLFTFGFGSSAPCTQLLVLQNHKERSGTAASLMGASSQIVGSLVGPLIGLVPMTSAVPMGTAMLICAVLATAALWLVLRPRTLPRGALT